MDDGVREMGGVKGVRSDDIDRPNHVVIDEQFSRPFVTLHRNSYDTLLTPAVARRLARQLHRLARRIEQRDIPAKEPTT
ncbi:MAG TPA: hypothetical protein VF638_03050 [Sphingomonas sp.]|jgi:hypothetical protein